MDSEKDAKTTPTPALSAAPAPQSKPEPSSDFAGARTRHKRSLQTQESTASSHHSHSSYHSGLSTYSTYSASASSSVNNVDEVEVPTTPLPDALMNENGVMNESVDVAVANDGSSGRTGNTVDSNAPLNTADAKNTENSMRGNIGNEDEVEDILMHSTHSSYDGNTSLSATPAASANASANTSPNVTPSKKGRSTDGDGDGADADFPGAKRRRLETIKSEDTRKTEETIETEVESVVVAADIRGDNVATVEKDAEIKVEGKEESKPTTPWYERGTTLAKRPPAMYSVTSNLGLGTAPTTTSSVTTTATSASASNTTAAATTQEYRWRAHQLAEDYINLATSLTLPPTYLGPFNYSPQTGQYPLEQATTLGYLTSPLRRPTVIEKWNPYEITTFEAALVLYGKVFHKVQKWVKTKTTKEIIEFYYVWKKSEHYKRWKRQYEEMGSEVSDESEDERNNCGEGKGDRGDKGDKGNGDGEGSQKGGGSGSGSGSGGGGKNKGKGKGGSSGGGSSVTVSSRGRR